MIDKTDRTNRFWVQTKSGGTINLDHVKILDIVGADGSFQIYAYFEGGIGESLGSTYETRGEAENAILRLLINAKDRLLYT